MRSPRCRIEHAVRIECATYARATARSCARSADGTSQSERGSRSPMRVPARQLREHRAQRAVRVAVARPERHSARCHARASPCAMPPALARRIVARDPQRRRCGTEGRSRRTTAAPSSSQLASRAHDSPSIVRGITELPRPISSARDDARCRRGARAAPFRATPSRFASERGDSSSAASGVNSLARSQRHSGGLPRRHRGRSRERAIRPRVARGVRTVTSVITPSVPHAPVTRRTRSNPATFFTTRPPARTTSPVPVTTSQPST